MQNARRIQEQIDEMSLRTQARADVAACHVELVVSKRRQSESELAKYRLLLEGLAATERLLRERAASPHLEGALDLLGDLQRQARESVCRREGAAFAHRQIEEELRRRHTAATSRLRELEAQGRRAVEVAERRLVSDPGPGPAKTPIASSGEDAHESSLRAVEQ